MMSEALKNRLIVVLFLTTVIFFLGTIGSCNNIRRSRGAYQREMATRLDLEERVSKFTQEKETVEFKINKLSKDLEEEKASHQATKNALLQEQALNKSLKEELGKAGTPKQKSEAASVTSATTKPGSSK